MKGIFRRAVTGVITSAFHRVYYSSPCTWRQNTFLGLQIEQNPMDLWAYLTVVCQEQPAFIIQTGIANGGSLLYFAKLLDLAGVDRQGQVVGIDISLPTYRPEHPRIHMIRGNSTSSSTIREVESIIGSAKGMVVLDSDHSRSHVLNELELYYRFVGSNKHLVVEDTNVNGRPVFRSHGPGPYEAVETFLQNHRDEFSRNDDLWRRNIFSFHQYGWLRRK